MVISGRNLGMWVKLATLCLSSTLQKERKMSKTSTLVGMTAELGGDRVLRSSQNPHVVITCVVLLQPRPFLKLQILNVFLHLRKA